MAGRLYPKRTRPIKILQQTSEPVFIGKAGAPAAVLSAFQKRNTPGKFWGSWDGRVECAADFVLCWSQRPG